MKSKIPEKNRVPASLEPDFFTVPEGLIAQGHIGDYVAKIQKVFYMDLKKSKKLQLFYFFRNCIHMIHTIK